MIRESLIQEFILEFLNNIESKEKCIYKFQAGISIIKLLNIYNINHCKIRVQSIFCMYDFTEKIK